MSVKDNIANRWKELPPAGQYAIIGVGAYAGYRILKSIFSNDFSGGTTDHLTGGNDVTYTNQEFAIMADAFEAAVWAGFMGEVENDAAMREILMAMQTTDDVIHLNNAYGVRTRGWVIVEGGNLTQTVHKYLDTSDREAVNEYYQQQGIDFIFL